MPTKTCAFWAAETVHCCTNCWKSRLATCRCWKSMRWWCRRATCTCARSAAMCWRRARARTTMWVYDGLVGCTRLYYNVRGWPFHFQIIVGDCNVSLDQYIKDGKTFDFVFGDLTDIPISDTPTGEIWDFIRTILEKSFKILKKDGVYLQHVRIHICPTCKCLRE